MSSVRAYHGLWDSAIFALFISSHSELQRFPEVNYFFRTNSFSDNLLLNQMLISVYIKASHWTFISSQTNSVCTLSPRTFEIHFDKVSQLEFSFRFLYEYFLRISHIFHAYYMPYLFGRLFDHSKSTKRIS